MRHNLKIAWRNLLKYKMQTTVCVCGLAVGFICFALSLLWVRYETTFDHFHPDAARLYYCYTDWKLDQMQSPYAGTFLAQRLNREFPEVERATAFVPGNGAFMEADTCFVEPTMIDENFSKVFRVKVCEGNGQFWHDPSQVAISRRTATACFGDQPAVGKTVYDAKGRPLTVGAVTEDWPQSNISTDVLQYMPLLNGEEAQDYACQIVLKTAHADTDLSNLLQQLNGNRQDCTYDICLEPLTEVRSTLFSVRQSIRTVYLKLFVAISTMIILAVLINTCSFQTGRIPRRLRELAIRKVCGATDGQLLGLLLTEFLCLLAMALLLGFILLEIVRPWFCGLTGIDRNLTGEVGLYFLGLSVVSVAAFLLFVWTFSRHTLQSRLHSSSRAWLPRLNLTLQFAVSFFMLFCVILMGRQLYYLSTTTDIGWERRDRIVVNRDEDTSVLADRIARLPGVSRVCPDENSMLCYNIFSPMDASWDGQPENAPRLRLKRITGRRVWMDFWHIRLLAGHCPTAAEARAGHVMINETALRALGWKEEEAPGRRLFYAQHVFTVAGIVKDFHISAPTVPVDPYIIIGREYEGLAPMPGDILVACQPGQTDSVCARIKRMLEERHLRTDYANSVTAVYDDLLTDERLLMRLILLASGVCGCVALFCIYTFVTLVCELRRKEIAIRKVNGATAGNIFRAFVGEYLACLAVAAAVAFPLGYLAVRHWQEQYVEQLPVGWAIYPLLFSGMAVVVTACIGGQVWRAARRQPTEMLEKE